MANYRIEIKKSFWRQRYYLVLFAENGKKVMHGENLNNYADAVELADHIADGNFSILDDRRDD